MRTLAICLLVMATQPALARDIDADSGLVVAPGFQETKTNCTVCHSARLITQARADRDGWMHMIRWMQKTQNLWPLGPNEDVILDYLAEHYAPESLGRRPNLPARLMPPE